MRMIKNDGRDNRTICRVNHFIFLLPGVNNSMVVDKLSVRHMVGKEVFESKQGTT